MKVYSRTGPFVSNPTYGRTTASLTTVRHFLPETRLKPCGISRPLLSAPISGSYNHPEGVAGAKKKHLHACTQAALQQIQRFRMSNKRGMFMMAHFRVSGYEHLRSCESISRRKRVDGCARSSRTAHHSLTLSPSESPAPVLTGTALSVAPSTKRVEATPRSPARPVRPTR